MDFHTQVITAGGTARLAADALLLVLVGDALPPGLDAPLADAVDEAIKHGDLKLKAGQTAYLRQVAGVKATRVAVAVAKDGSAKAVKVAGLSLIHISEPTRPY